MLLLILPLLFGAAPHRDTLNLLIDTGASPSGTRVLGDSATVRMLRDQKSLLQIIQTFDSIRIEGACDEESSDTLDLQIHTENTRKTKTRWVRAGPMYPYGERRIKRLMNLTAKLNLVPALERDAARPERAVDWLGRRGGAPLFGAVTRRDKPSCGAGWDGMRPILVRDLG